MIKKTITILFLSIFILGFATPIVFAQDQVYDFQLNQNKSLDKFFEDELLNIDTNQDADQMSGGITITASQVPNIIEKISLWLYRLVMVLSVGFIILSAFYFLRGGDNPIYVKKAKSQLVYAIIGIIIALASFGIGKFIENIIRSGS
jgi:hypothetical protein